MSAPPAGTYSYAWDAEGRMKTVTPYSGTATNYVYNALGQRVEKYTGSAYTEIVYDAFGNQVGLHNQTTWVAHYIPFGGRPFVKYQSGKTYFLHPNHLGSTTMVTDETGATTQKTIYYPWGQAWATAGTVKDDRFASMDARDSETGNDPTLFRMNNSRLYRWLSPDPLAGDISNPQSLNRYAYVMNSPANLTASAGVSSEIPAIYYPGPKPGPPPPSPGPTAASSKPITCCGPVKRYEKPIDVTDMENICRWFGCIQTVHKDYEWAETTRDIDIEPIPFLGAGFNPPEIAGYFVGLNPILDYLNAIPVLGFDPIYFENQFSRNITRITSPGPGCVYIWATHGIWGDPTNCPPPPEAIQAGLPTDPRTYNNPPPSPPPPQNRQPFHRGLPCGVISWNPCTGK